MIQDIQTLLRQAAAEIASEGHNGWGNLMTWAANHIEALERQLAALRQAERQVPEWQPIETAPKDGTPILCFNVVTGAYNSAYIDGHFPCGFWGRPGTWYPTATHWAQRPAAPSAGQAKPEGDGH